MCVIILSLLKIIWRDERECSSSLFSRRELSEKYFPPVRKPVNKKTCPNETNKEYNTIFIKFFSHEKYFSWEFEQDRFSWNAYFDVCEKERKINLIKIPMLFNVLCKRDKW